MATGIYRIRNNTNGKCYIGSSVDLEMRKAEHFRYLRGGYHANRKLQAAYNKYGEDAFVFDVIEACDKRSLLTREQYYLDQLNFDSNYNIARVAGSPMMDRKHTAESKASMSINTSGSKNPMYGVPSPMTGKTHSDEVKQRISDHHSGTGNPMYGKSGALSPTSKKVIVDGVQYDSVTLAGQALGVSRKVVEYRIKSEKYPGYQNV